MPRRPLVKVASSLIVLVLVACGGERGGAGESAPLISMHLASQEERPGYTRVEFEGATLFVAPEPLIDDDEIAAAEAEPGEAGAVVGIELTAPGAARIRQATAENIGEPMVLRFDSEIIGAPIIRAEITGSRATLVVPAASDDEARAIVNRVRARWPARDSTSASN